MEKSINKVALSGFAGMNPEVKNLNGKAMVRFSLATSSSYKKPNDEWVRDTTWHNIIMWDKVAEQAQEQIKKGSFVNLSGKIVNRQYTDKSGTKKNVVEIRAFDFSISDTTKTQE